MQDIHFSTPLHLLSASQLNELTSLFSDKEISSRYGFSRTAVTYHRKRLCVQSFAEKHGTRKYDEHYEPRPDARRIFSHRLNGLRSDFFNQIDSPAKAYWLGLLYADGWIVTHKGEPTAFAIALDHKDEYLLRQLAESLGCPSAVRRERKGSSLMQLKISSQPLVAALINHGVVPRKSRTIKMPQLEAGLYSSFVRGYFDGDGSVVIRGNSITAQVTSGSETMLKGLAEQLEAAAGIQTKIQSDRGAFVARWYALNAVALAKHMYAKCQGDPFMKRKRDRFNAYLATGAGRSWEQLLAGLASAPSR